MRKKVSFITAGHSPREDIVDELEKYLPQEIEIRQRGAMDDLTANEVKTLLSPLPEEDVMTSRLSDGSMANFSKEKGMPLLQKAIDKECDAGASLIVILCTNQFDRLECRVPVIVPFDLLHRMIPAIKGDCKVGALFPFEAFAGRMAKSWEAYGVQTVYQCAKPAEAQKEQYVDFFKKEKTDMLILDCIGYTYDCRNYFAQQLNIPVIHPRSMIVHTIQSLLDVD